MRQASVTGRNACVWSGWGMYQRCADPQISRPRIICIRKHQARGRSVSATVMATHVRGPSASASRVGLHCIQQTMPRVPHSQRGFLTQPTAVSKYGSVLKLLRTGTLALPFEVGPADNTRGCRSADGPRPQICLFGGSTDRPRPQENLRIRGYLRPQSAHL